MAGGYYPLPQDDEVSTNSLVAYDPRKRTWQSVAPMPTARGHLRLVAADDHLYAIGGLADDGNSLSTVERYDPHADRWTTLAPMSVGRRAMGAVAVRHGSDTLIAAVGGCQTVNGTLVGLDETTELYSVRTGTWQTLPARLPGGRCSLNAAAEPDGTVLAIVASQTSTTAQKPPRCRPSTRASADCGGCLTRRPARNRPSTPTVVDPGLGN